MGLFSSVLGAIGGNSAANKMGDAARSNRNYATGVMDDIKQWTNPYVEGGQEAYTSFMDLLRNPGELDPTTQAIIDRNQTDTYNMLRSRGMGGSGSGWSTLLSMGLRDRLGARQQRMSELLQGASFGPNAVQQRIQGAGITLPAVTQANTAIGDAKAYGANQWWSIPGQLQNEAAQVAGVVSGGGFG